MTKMKAPSYKIIRNALSALACAVLFSACAVTGAVTGASTGAPTAVQGFATAQSTPAHVSNSNVTATAVIDDTGPDAASVQVAKANPNKRFVLRPLGSEASSDRSAVLVGDDYIKIIGSYFPKVVYRAPQLNAKLLMRVAPGSTFPLEKLNDGWYQISTDQGPGFLRLEDGVPTTAKG